MLFLVFIVVFWWKCLTTTNRIDRYSIHLGWVACFGRVCIAHRCCCWSIFAQSTVRRVFQLLIDLLEYCRGRVALIRADGNWVCRNHVLHLSMIDDYTTGTFHTPAKVLLHILQTEPNAHLQQLSEVRIVVTEWWWSNNHIELHHIASNTQISDAGPSIAARYFLTPAHRRAATQVYSMGI